MLSDAKDGPAACSHRRKYPGSVQQPRITQRNAGVRVIDERSIDPNLWHGDMVAGMPAELSTAIDLSTQSPENRVRPMESCSSVASLNMSSM